MTFAASKTISIVVKDLEKTNTIGDVFTALGSYGNIKKMELQKVRDNVNCVVEFDSTEAPEKAVAAGRVSVAGILKTVVYARPLGTPRSKVSDTGLFVKATPGSITKEELTKALGDLSLKCVITTPKDETKKFLFIHCDSPQDRNLLLCDLYGKEVNGNKVIVNPSITTEKATKGGFKKRPSK